MVVVLGVKVSSLLDAVLVDVVQISKFEFETVM